MIEDKTALLIDAARMCISAHGDQVRKYTGEPYPNHPAEVAAYAAHHGLPSHIVAAGFLHDVVEDTLVTARQLADRFPQDVCDAVDFMTDREYPGSNRSQRKSLERDRRSRGCGSQQSLNLLDLVSNTKTIARFDPKFAPTYLAEKAALIEVLPCADFLIRDRAIRSLAEAERHQVHRSLNPLMVDEPVAPVADVVLEGVVGSTAYGLADEHSDVDVLGIYQEPLSRVLAIGWNQKRATRTTSAPDSTHHEVGKFLRLVVGGNPTVTELLWLDDYEVVTPVGALLVAHRGEFLSTSAVRNAYLGYANQQAQRLLRRDASGQGGFSSDLKKRTKKHGRHCWRLMIQARSALTEGHIEVDVGHRRDEIFSIGELAAADSARFAARFEAEFQAVKGLSSILPDKPDLSLADRLLYAARVTLAGDEEKVDG